MWELKNTEYKQNHKNPLIAHFELLNRINDEEKNFITISSMSIGRTSILFQQYNTEHEKDSQHLPYNYSYFVSPLNKHCLHLYKHPANFNLDYIHQKVYTFFLLTSNSIKESLQKIYYCS